MENKNEKFNIDAKAKALQEIMKKMEAEANDYPFQWVEIKLISSQHGSVKGVLSVADILTITQVHNSDIGEIIKSLYISLEQDLIKKIKNDNEGTDKGFKEGL
jgi:hypothetical protein